MLGSEFPKALDTYTVGSSPYLASAVINQVAEIVENTERVMGQSLGDLSDLGNTVEDTFAKQWKNLLRVDCGIFAFNTGVGTQIVAAHSSGFPGGTREVTVTFNTYGGASVFDTAADIVVFVVEAGSQNNMYTTNVITGQRRDTGNVVDGQTTTAQFKYRHDDRILGNCLYLAIQRPN